MNILEELLKIVSEETKILSEDIKGKTKTKEIVFARDIFSYISNVKLKKPLTDIAKFLNKDHTTIIHCVNKIKNRILNDKKVSNFIDTIYNKCPIENIIKGRQYQKDFYKFPKYYSSEYLTNNELFFFKKLQSIYEDKFNIQCQIPLRQIIKKDYDFNSYELNRRIDFGIFTKEDMKLLLLIELNDRTHEKYKTMKRDYNVEKILQSANINLIKFYADMPNECAYIKNRIDKIIQGIRKK